MKKLMTVVAILFFLTGSVGPSLASESTPPPVSPGAVALILLLMTSGSGSTGVHNLRPGN